MTRIRGLLLVALAACSEKNLAGTYVGEASGFYRLPGDTHDTSFTLPNETVIVETTARHYQAYEYRLSIRGCELRVEGENGSASTHSPARTCTFDVPNVGPVTIAPSGGLSREKDAPGIAMSLSASDPNGKVTFLAFSLHAKPR